MPLSSFHMEVRWFRSQRQVDSRGSQPLRLASWSSSSCHLKPSKTSGRGFLPSQAIALATLGWVLLGLYFLFFFFLLCFPPTHNIWEIFYYLLRNGLAIYCRLASDVGLGVDGSDCDDRGAGLSYFPGIPGILSPVPGWEAAGSTLG